jgi:mono/diheme cytochrome c family protein/nitrate reductase cytochrome c-type subunit
MKYLGLLMLFAVLTFSCNNSKNKDYYAFEKQKEANTHPGKKLMETNCYTCHNPTGTHDERIGPPMIAIKKHYISDETTKEEFIASIQSWIKNPNEEDAKMFGAVRRFGVMPKQAFPEETIKQIADYMYEFDIDQPEWFEDHFNEEKGKHNGKGVGKGKGKGKGNGQGMGNGKGKGMQRQQAQTNFEKLPYAERGLKYALTTKAVLGKNLMGVLQKKGTLEALAFCNENAYPLTDSMATVHNASIKRVSDKPRNEKNNANSEELHYINTFKQVIANNKEPSPIVKELDDEIHVYYPITTNDMCLQCHGKPNETIEESTLNTIAVLYPNDKAIGYHVNEVRGIWSITFDN